eukprot:scaffold4184_cov393-Alexandrium_tamarense.AAC.2
MTKTNEERRCHSLPTRHQLLTIRQSGRGRRARQKRTWPDGDNPEPDLFDTQLVDSRYDTYYRRRAYKAYERRRM